MGICPSFYASSSSIFPFASVGNLSGWLQIACSYFFWSSFLNFVLQLQKAWACCQETTHYRDNHYLGIHARIIIVHGHYRNIEKSLIHTVVVRISYLQFYLFYEMPFYFLFGTSAASISIQVFVFQSSNINIYGGPL